MFINCVIMNIEIRHPTNLSEINMTAIIQTRRNKHFLLNQSRLKEAQKVLGAKTETETVELALERVITEAEQSKEAWLAQDKFLKAAARENLEIKDIFGRLEEK